MKSFLNRIDQYLLKNCPLVWTTRIHYFIPWWILSAGIIFLGIMAQNPVTYDGTESLLGWLVLLAICGLVLWIIYYFRFNKWKSFGNYKTGESLAFWGLNLIVVGLLAVVPHLGDMGRFVRANSDYSDRDIVQDINAFNFARAYAAGPPDQLMSKTVTTSKDSGLYESVRNYRLSHPLNDEDSAIMKPDSIVIFEFSGFTSIDVVDKVMAKLQRQGLKVWSGKEIYNLLKARGMIGEPKLLREGFPTGEQGEILTRLIKKYGFSANDYIDVVSGTERTIDRIADAKFTPLFYDEDYYRLYFYAVFAICLLLYIFKNTTLKTFGVSAGVAVLLPFLVVLIMLMIHPKKDADGFIVPFIFYIIFAVLAFTVFSSRKRNIFQGIALNFFTLCSPFLGVYFAAWYSTGLRESWQAQHHENSNLVNYVEPYPDFDQYIFTGELIGIVLFFILLEPLFQRMYLKWYALPEE